MATKKTPKKKTGNVKKIDGLSADVQSEKIEQLKQVAPEIFADGKIDVAKLRKLAGEEMLADDERYRLEWAGKSKVFDEIAERSSCTLTLDPKRSSKDWEKSNNIFIEGENLEVLRVLQKAYHGKVKMIYIDPPYNTGKDFVYNDNFKETEEEYCEDECNVDENGLLKKAYKLNSRDGGRFHSNWLSMMYPRLYLGRNLLRDDGVIFVSIDDNEVHNLRHVMDEIYGEENFIAQVVWERAYAPVNLKRFFSESHDYVLVYAKNSEVLGEINLSRTDDANARYDNPDNDPRGVWQSDNFSVGPVVEEKVYEITLPSGRKVLPPKGRCWLLTKERYQEYLDDNRIHFTKKGDGVPRIKRFLSEVKNGATPMTLWKYSEVGHSQDATKGLKKLFGDKSYFDYPKPVTLIQRMIDLGSSEGDLILDFFSGSATTAHAVMKQSAVDGKGRNYICVQMPEELDKNSEAYKDGYRKVSDIAIKRIELASKEVKKDYPEFNGDLGLRVYEESESYFPQWHSRAFETDADLKQAMIDYDKKTPSGTPEERATEVLLKLGYPLTTPLEAKKGYFMTADGVALVLDSATKADSLLKILDEEVKTIVVLEKIFKKDEQKINFGLRCKEAGITLQTV